MRMARVAVFTMFALNGVIVGSWTGRVPAIARQVHAGPGAMGVALLGMSIGLLLVAPFAGRLSARFGARTIVATSVASGYAALPLIGLASSVPALSGALFLVGGLVGGLDVSMNIAAVAVIRALDRPIMPTFHAAFSFGGLVGALLASRAAAWGWSPLREFVILAIAGLVAVALTGRFIPGARPAPGARDTPRPATRAPSHRLVMWLFAGIMLGSAVAEGACSDWSALFLVRQRGIGESAAAVAYAGFSIAMAVARLLGERWERRWGPYRLLAGGAALAAIGMGGAVVLPGPVAGYVGFALAGVGLAFCFPISISLAGAAGRRSDGTGGEREIGFVTTIAYTGFLGGPPLIGAVAQGTNLSIALGVVTAIIALIVPVVVLARLAFRREAAAPVPAPTA